MTPTEEEHQSATLRNGASVHCLHLSSASTTAVGIWLFHGSRHQPEACNGYAHLLEHLLFKGSQRTSADSLTKTFEAMGGQINAYTGRELTAIHGFVPNAQVPRLVKLFTELLCQPRFNYDDVVTESDIVIEEIRAANHPAEQLEQQAVAASWANHAMSWPIAGDPLTLKQANAEKLRNYLGGILTGKRLWVVSVGGTPLDTLIDSVQELEQLPSGMPPMANAPAFHAQSFSERRPFSQSYLHWTFTAPPISHPDYMTTVVANHLLGGGISSRLFQQLRESQGLVYDIQSHLELYSDCGLWHIHTSCEGSQNHRCLDGVETCVDRLIHSPLNDDDIAVTRSYLRANLMLEQSQLVRRMERFARQLIYCQPALSIDQQLAAIDDVSAESTRTLLSRHWRNRSFGNFHNVS